MVTSQVVMVENQALNRQRREQKIWCGLTMEAKAKDLIVTEGKKNLKIGEL